VSDVHVSGSLCRCLPRSFKHNACLHSLLEMCYSVLLAVNYFELTGFMHVCAQGGSFTTTLPDLASQHCCALFGSRVVVAALSITNNHIVTQSFDTLFSPTPSSTLGHGPLF
jgi:hypothetical protein